MSDFEKHYAELFDYVYRYVFVRLRDKDSTDDVVSTIFLSAFEKQYQYDDEKGSWRQWITGIARNAVFKHWQSKTDVLNLDALSLDISELERFSDERVDRDHKLDFQSIMDTVSPDVRMLLVLRYEEDLTYEAIAELLHKTPAAVRKTFSRLHQQLKVQFKDLID